MQVTFKGMSQSKRARYSRGEVWALGIGLLCLPGGVRSALAQADSASQGPASGPSTGPTSSPVATAQQQLYTASGTNGAQPTQDSFQGSVVEGKSTGAM